MSDLPGQSTQSSSPPGHAPAVPAGEMQAASGPSGPRAGFWQRFGALVVDSLVLLIPIVVITLIVEDAVLANALTTLLSFVYYVALEGSASGQTVGKRVLGIRVLDFQGGTGSIGYGRAVVRNLVKYISAIPLLLGYLWMLWDREKQCWHDKAASSVVVPVDAYPVPR